MFPYELIRSERKTIAIHILPQGRIQVRCPRRMPRSEVEQFLESKARWVEKHLLEQEEKPKTDPFTREALDALTDRARMEIPKRVNYFAPLVDVTFGNITIRSQRTRWGSCSAQGNLNFNCLLMLAPPPVLDYVVVHELCHRREMNHSPRFWALVESILPDYRQSRRWLKENGGSLIGRLP